MYGDPILRGLANFADEIGLSRNSYNMIYEGFWDLYCRKAVPAELTAKKLEPWVNFVNLSLPSFEYPVAAEGAEGEEPVNEVADVKAVARIRIPFKRPEPKEEEE